MTDEGERGSTENATTGDQPVDGGDAPSSQNPGLVRLRWLKINKYRNVRTTTLRFDDGHNVMLGLNGTGKTTLLKVLAAVISSNFSQLSSAYDLEYELEILGISVVARAWVSPESRATAPLVLDHDTAGRAGRISSARRCFSGAFRSSSTGLSWSLAIERDAAVFGDDSSTLDLPAELSFGDRPSLWALVVASFAAVGPRGVAGLSPAEREAIAAVTATVRRLDESLETLQVLLAGDDEPGDLLTCPVVSAAADAARTSAPAPHGPGAGGFWLRLPTTQEAADTRGLTASVESAGPLTELAKATGLHVAMTVRFLRSQPLGESFLHSYQGLGFSVRHRSGEVTTHEPLSYGQKRLLTFLYYLAVNDYVVIADELVNGLHHSWIKLCLDQIGQRQAFLTSQNPILLDYLPPVDVEQARKQFIVCRTERTAAGEQLVWENMSEESAERVMSAYGVGIQSLSEVLESKGLW